MPTSRTCSSPISARPTRTTTPCPIPIREHALSCVHAPKRPLQLHRRHGEVLRGGQLQCPGRAGAWTVFGGQHAWNAANSFAYAVVPYPGNVGGGYSNTISADAPTVLDFLTAVSSHELVEASTDAEAYVNADGSTTALGWYFSPPGAGPGCTGGGTEIGDPLTGQDVWETMTNSTDPTVSDTWFVQLYWSNFIPLSTAPHDWPQVAARQPSIFRPSQPSASKPPPAPHSTPAQPPLHNVTPHPTGDPSSPRVPGGASLVQPDIAASPTNPQRPGCRLAKRPGRSRPMPGPPGARSSRSRPRPTSFQVEIPASFTARAAASSGRT